MPELPEVEFGRRLAETVAGRRRIQAVTCARDAIVFDGRTPRFVRRALEGARVASVARRGKYIVFELDRGLHPIFHFGMTGAFRVRDATPLKLRSHGARVDDDWPPRFAKLQLTFDDGGELVMTNARRLGRVLFRERPFEEAPLVRLGFDPLVGLPPEAVFADLVGRRRVTLKGLLLDQGFAAGVGNWIADEVLYQARLDPRRRADTLTAAETKRLRAKLGHVVRRAVAVDADKSRFPRTWLFHRRWGRVRDARTVCGEPIEFLTLAGRTTAWVPRVQGGVEGGRTADVRSRAKP